MVLHESIAARSLFLLLLLCMKYDFQSVAGEASCVKEEREALLRFKQGVIDYYGFLTFSWGDGDCCRWPGVVCSNSTGHVTSLLLANLALEGEISSSLLDLNHLNNLDLSDNYFGWSSLSKIPDFIGSMKQLQHLNLRNSYFDGVIPPQLGNLTSLRSLDLSQNYLRSNNLDWVSSLSELTRLNLTLLDSNGSNWIQPVLTLPSLRELYLRGCGIREAVVFLNSSSSKSLSILDLSGNRLTSSPFDWLFNLTSLAKISLSNAIKSRIPDKFERFVSLEHLDLFWNNLEGEIPKSLGNLGNLRKLSLGGNKLGGSVQGLFGNVSCNLEIVVLSFNNFEGRFPETIACSKLRALAVANNNLMGSLPVSIGELSELQILDVSFNSLEGEITGDYFKKLHGLTVLDLSFNSFTVKLPSDWNPPFRSCQFINLAYCKIGKRFPEWIQTQSNLRALDLSASGMFDEIPQWLWSFSPNLFFLNLSSNQINGILPNLSNTSLFSLILSYNNLSGPIPLFPPNISYIHLSQNMFTGSISSICTVTFVQLGYLDISSNQLSGEIPNCWERMVNLMYLDLGNNSFSGNFPHALGSLQSLITLHLRDNNLSGEFPLSLKSCRFLELIDIGENDFTGSISWIGVNFTRVNYLILRGNRFHGSIPPEVCHLSRIRVMDLSRNNLSGEIPDCFYNFTSLGENSTVDPFVGSFGSVSYNLPVSNGYFPKYDLENAFVQWKGHELEYRRTLGYLKMIDLSSNRISGKIPGSLSSLKGLISLNLSRNSFEGEIIPGIGQMAMLECLDLSRNRLSGHIPTSLARLHFLAVLDLSSNSLSGEIPTSTQLQSFDASSYGGNAGLCGHPLVPCPEESGPSIEIDGDDRSVGLSFLQEVLISVGLGFIVGFWGFVGCLVVKKSWRRAYFGFWDWIGDWLYVHTALFIAKFRSRRN